MISLAVRRSPCWAAPTPRSARRRVRDRAGIIHFAKSADSSFDRFSQAPTPARQQWMRTKYWRMRAYSPYFDTRTAWYQRAWFYKDAMAIYPGETGVPSDFYLRDAQGRRLYIWYDCGGGSCSQFAGDIGSPAFRAAWIADARRSYAQGYKGLFVDDVNMQQRISDGNGNLQWPLDPRTGQLDERAVLAPLHGRVHGADPRASCRAPRSSTTRSGSTATPIRSSAASRTPPT